VSGEINYLTLDDFFDAAVEAMRTDLVTVQIATNVPLAESALAAPGAGFDDFEKYPTFPLKAAVLLQRIASNHALPDGNKVSGKVDGLSVAEIIVSVVGDEYAQEELDQENDEANRYPLGPKEYWRGRMVGKYRYGRDGHLMTNDEFESDWEAVDAE
jgi:death-on-curing protein